MEKKQFKPTLERSLGLKKVFVLMSHEKKKKRSAGEHHHRALIWPTMGSKNRLKCTTPHVLLNQKVKDASDTLTYTPIHEI